MKAQLAEAELKNRDGGSPSRAAHCCVVAARVKVDLEEMQQWLSAEQQRAMIDGIGEVLKASPPPHNDAMRAPGWDAWGNGQPEGQK